MKKIIKILLSALLILIPQIQAFALPMNSHMINHFKKIICDCAQDALEMQGEFKNNSYYVNLNEGTIKNYQFNNAIVKFQDLTEKGRNKLIDSGCCFEDIQNSCSIKLAGDFSIEEIQNIINDEIKRPATAKRIFNQAELAFDDDIVNVSGTINMKKVPGNPLAMLSNDEFVPFSAKFAINVEGTLINLNIIDGNINGQDMTPEVIQMFHNWLNPLFDFSKLDFPCNVQEYKISNKGIRVTGTLF